MSDVASGPWARKAGQKTSRPREMNPPAVPNSARDQRKTSHPVAALTTAITARA